MKEYLCNKESLAMKKLFVALTVAMLLGTMPSLAAGNDEENYICYCARAILGYDVCEKHVRWDDEVEDLVEDCIMPGVSYDQFVNCVENATADAVQNGYLSSVEKDVIDGCAAEPDIP